MPTTTAVIPIHNEATFLREAVARLLATVGELQDVTIVLAENGSTDGTAELAQELAASSPKLRALHLDEPDYGAAMRAGFLSADTDWVVNFDIDYFSADFLREAVASSADIVLASKRTEGSEDLRVPLRRLATWGFNLLLRGLFRSGVSDTHGMKALRRAVIESVVPEVGSTQDLFDTELVLRAERAGFTIEEVPARVEELRTARSSIWRRVPRTLMGMLRLRWRMWRRGT